MKYYRILQLEPYLSIVNIEKDGAQYVGYTDIQSAAKDLAVLVNVWEDRQFQIVPYTTLPIDQE